MLSLADIEKLMQIMKQSAVDAVNAAKPAKICFGTVVSASPLAINVEQKLTLYSEQLALAREVTDYVTEITVDWETEDEEGGSGEEAFAKHKHGIKGRKSVIVHNGLKVGDSVVLMRIQGGQKYLVVDRI